MMSQNKFTFTWQIVNFSMCPHKLSENEVSPVFAVEMMRDSEWELQLYPRGNDSIDENISCYLVCKEVGRKANALKIDFSLSIVTEDVNKKISYRSEYHEFKKYSNFGYRKFASRRNIFSNKETYLPNDTLTIECSMWQSEKDSVTSEPDIAMLPTDRKTHFNNSNEFNGCTVVTCVEMVRKNISWPIRNFSSIGFNERLVIYVPSALKDAQSFQITLYKSIADKSVEIEIQNENVNATKDDTFVKCKASVIQIRKDVEYVAEDNYLFEDSNTIWKFPSFIKLQELHTNRYLERTSDILHLYFEFSFSTSENIHHTEKDGFIQYGSLMNISEPIDQFQRLYKDGDVFDMVIRACDREFKVLKNILKARSPVFGAMFDSDMKEKGTNVVEISDIDPDTLDRMLVFIYSNALEDLKSEDAIKLYTAADKYQVDPLKFRCTWILAARISVSNVGQVLNLADRHSDDYLRYCGERFIRANSRGVFESQSWDELIAANPKLAATLMHKILKN